MLCFLLRRNFPPNLLFSQCQSCHHHLRFCSKSKGDSFTVSYLIHHCGFQPQRAASASKFLNFKTREKPDSVIRFFENQGFSQTQLLNIIRCYPGYLVYNPEKSLKTKIDFFKSKGFSESDIHRIVTGCPTILSRSLDKQIIPCFNFFLNVFQCNVKLMKTIKRHAGILFDHGKQLEPNIKLLREERVPESHIVKSIEYFPRTSTVSPKKFKEKVQQVKELGFNPLSMQFVKALHVRLCIGESTWARKEGIYRKWGWTDNDISKAFKSFPLCIAVSEDKIEAVMDFLVNRSSFTSSAIARFPIVLSMSLDKRIVPRVSVILVLLSKGLVNKLSLSAIFNCNEKVFLDKFVYCHEKEANELLKLYQANLVLAR